MSNAVELHDVSRAFGEGHTRVVALHPTTMTVDAGEFVAIMGPSGSGKTTLLSLIGGLDRPSGGRIGVAGQDLAFFRRRDMADTPTAADDRRRRLPGAIRIRGAVHALSIRDRTVDRVGDELRAAPYATGRGGCGRDAAQRGHHAGPAYRRRVGPGRCLSRRLRGFAESPLARAVPPPAAGRGRSRGRRI